MVVENLREVEKRVCEACRRAGRDRDEVTLIAVSKTKPASMIEELFAIGTRDFGENKVQELCGKYEALPKAGEESKFGVSPEETENLVREAAKLPGIQVQGLMTIAPFVENPEENRAVFSNLKKLYVDIKTKNIDNVAMNVLSMGMTNDYEVAIEEGATMIRVGTGIFGVRYEVWIEIGDK